MNESRMGGAMQHWLGFQDKIGRAFMMNEDALKYPLSDYLVNDGGIDIKTIELGYSHPDFSRRFIDLVVKDVFPPYGIINAFELKLAKTNTRQESEKRRIFNDLMRLHLVAQQTSGKCYFIVAGESIHFQRDFRKYHVNGKEFYKKWFSFEIDKQLTFKVASEIDPLYKEIYHSFLNEYALQFKSSSSLSLPTQITTKCEFVTGFRQSLVPYMTGIWSIS